MKKINENTKVTLTLKQLKKLVKESAPVPEVQEQINKVFTDGLDEIVDIAKSWFESDNSFNGGYYSIMNTDSGDGADCLIECIEKVGEALKYMLISDGETYEIDEAVKKTVDKIRKLAR